MIPSNKHVIYTLEGKNESDISPLWQILQIFFYVCCVTFGFLIFWLLNSIILGMKNFCVLHTNVLLTNRTFDFVYGKNVSCSVDILQPMIRWNDCDVILVSAVLTATVATFLVVMFYYCGRGGAGKPEMPNSWRIVMPATGINIIGFCIAINSQLTFITGINSFENNIKKRWGLTATDFSLLDVGCLELDGKKIGKQLVASLYGLKQYIFVWTAFWGFNLFWILLRCFLSIDFQLIRTTVYQYPRSPTLIRRPILNYPRRSTTTGLPVDHPDFMERTETTVRFRKPGSELDESQGSDHSVRHGSVKPEKDSSRRSTRMTIHDSTSTTDNRDNRKPSNDHYAGQGSDHGIRQGSNHGVRQGSAKPEKDSSRRSTRMTIHDSTSTTDNRDNRKPSNDHYAGQGSDHSVRQGSVKPEKDSSRRSTRMTIDDSTSTTDNRDDRKPSNDHYADQGSDHGVTQGSDHGVRRGSDHGVRQDIDHGVRQRIVKPEEGSSRRNTRKSIDVSTSTTDNRNVRKPSSSHNASQGSDHDVSQGSDHSGSQGSDDTKKESSRRIIKVYISSRRKSKDVSNGTTDSHDGVN